MTAFNPSRLSLARERRGFTQTSLAYRLGVDRRTIVGYEADEITPSLEMLSRIAIVLDFPETFFGGDDLEVPTKHEVSFRAMSKMKAGQRDMAMAQGALALQLCKWTEERFNLPPVDLPDLSREDTPEEAATALRYVWGWGEHAIPNMIHLVESRGVRVFSLSIESREVDAFSLWKDATPLMFLNTQKSAEHSRFDVAHELGHLVLHRHASPAGREAEREADAFASAFLMPAKSVIAKAPRLPTLEMLINLKHEWKVSIAALCYRLHTLHLISDWAYRKFYIEIGKKGYRFNEPQSEAQESSMVLSKVVAAITEEGLTKSGLASQLSLHPRELDQLMFGLVITSLRGGRAREPLAAPTDVRPRLEVVK